MNANWNLIALSSYCVHFQNTRKPNTMSLIVKTMIPNGTQHYLNVAVGIFKKEIEFYSQIGPQMNALAKPLEIARIFPAVYGVCELNNVMLLEDLDFSGFQAIPIRTGFNMRETKAVLKKLAAFHAISAVLREHQPDIFQHFKYGLCLNPNSWFQYVHDEHLSDCMRFSLIHTKQFIEILYWCMILIYNIRLNEVPISVCC